jgi:hypothetical protein
MFRSTPILAKAWHNRSFALIVVLTRITGRLIFAGMEAANGFRLGDRVRIKSGPYRGQSGSVAAVSSAASVVVLVTGVRISTPVDSVTNLSRAARRAWASRPKHAGRPAYSTPRKKMISLRIDIDTLDALSVLAEQGLIMSRERAVNEWLRARATELLRSLKADQGSRGVTE